MKTNPRSMTATELHQIRSSSLDSFAIDYGFMVAFVGVYDGGRVSVRAYIGKAAKAAQHYGFKSQQQAGEWLDGYAKRMAEYVAIRSQWAAERKAFAHTLKPGDVLYSSWGYEQTNVCFYQVIAITAKTATVRSIGSERVDTHYMSGRCIPVPGSFSGEPMTRRVSSGNSIRIDRSESASPVQFKEVAGARVYESKFFSSYA